MFSATLVVLTTPLSVSGLQTVVSSPVDLNRTSVGSEPLDALADRIWRSVGPSGRNKVTPRTSDSQQ